MSLFRLAQLCALTIVLSSGCQTAGQVSAARPALERLHDDVPTSSQEPPAAVSKVSFEEPLPEDEQVAGNRPPGELSVDWLVDEVQRRNPSLQAMVAAWRAAAARYPQAVSLDDPMFMTMAAPASFDSADVEAGYVFQGSQKFPWFGKRAARGRVARAESNAAFHDVEDSRVRLAEATRIAFYDYYVAQRQLDLNRQNLEIIRQLRSTAQSRYQANQVTQQDVLQAEVELAELERRSLELERANRIAIARANTLLREEPFNPLPPPPATLPAAASPPDVGALQEIAISQRPDLQALSARVRAEQASVTLACKDYYPDVEVFGRYDSFWQPADTQSDLRGQVGVNLNVPIYRGKLNAAVREALANLSQRRAEFEQRVLDVRYEVASSYEEVEESRQTLELYANKLIPAAEQNVSVARSNYDVNKTTFLDLAVAQRQLIELREKREEALAAYHMRQAELTRAIGGSEIAAQGSIEVQ